MSNASTDLIGKPIKDMYGSHMGKAAGTSTGLDGSIQTVGVDCGHSGLRQIPFEQLVVQGDSIIFIPRWRLDSQRLLREKGLTVRRLRALMDIVSENDEMKDDAALVYDRYRSQLDGFEDSQRRIGAELESRLVELGEQLRVVKMIVFDARVQSKSGEIDGSAFEAVRKHTTGLLEHITHEKAEIESIRGRLEDLDARAREVLEDRTSIEGEGAAEGAAPGLPEAPAHEPAGPYGPTRLPEVPPHVSAHAPPAAPEEPPRVSAPEPPPAPPPGAYARPGAGPGSPPPAPPPGSYAPPGAPPGGPGQPAAGAAAEPRDDWASRMQAQ